MNISEKILKQFEGKPVKSKSASKVLQLMDKDMEYAAAVKKISKEDNISTKQLDKELDPFI